MFLIILIIMLASTALVKVSALDVQSEYKLVAYVVIFTVGAVISWLAWRDE